MNCDPLYDIDLEMQSLIPLFQQKDAIEDRLLLAIKILACGILMGCVSSNAESPIFFLASLILSLAGQMLAGISVFQNGCHKKKPLEIVAGLICLIPFPGFPLLVCGLLRIISILSKC